METLHEVVARQEAQRGSVGSAPRMLSALMQIEGAVKIVADVSGETHTALQHVEALLQARTRRFTEVIAAVTGEDVSDFDAAIEALVRWQPAHAPYENALAALASLVGNGASVAHLPAAQWEARIRDGIDRHVRVEARRRVAALFEMVNERLRAGDGVTR